MLIGTGVDIVEIERVQRAVERRGEAFLERIYTPHELAFAGSSGARRYERLASRFAAKEAVMKALGTGWTGGVAWREIEVRAEAGKPPAVRLYGRAAEVAREKAVERIHLALSHSRGFALATAHAEGSGSAGPP